MVLAARSAIACALAAALLGSALGCGRDLSVPLLQPPQLSQVTPAAAFAGERVVLTGTSLGNGAGATVQIGGRTAEAAAPDATLPAESLAVLLPAGLDSGPLDVTVTTAAGKSTLTGAIRSLGLGHPTGLGLQGRFDLGVFPWTLSVQGDTAWVSDLSRDEVVAIDPLTGEMTGLVPLHGGVNPALVFGTSTAPWLFSVGELGHHPQLDRFDLTGPDPVKTCSSGELAAIGDGTHPAQAWGVAATADGTLLAAPTFGHSVALIDTTTCPPALKTVALPQKVWGLVPSGRDLVVALTDRFARVPEGGAPVYGPAVADAVSIDADGAMALDPGSRRLAYVRSDGNVGFVRWDNPTGQPTVEDGFIFTYGAVQKVAFGPTPLAGGPADRLYLRENERLVVYDLAPGKPAPAEPSLVATSPLEGVGFPLKVLDTGEVMAGIADGTTLFSRDGAPLRTWLLTGSLPGYSVAMGGDGRVLVASNFGPTAVIPDFSGGYTSFDAQGRALPFDGLSASDGPPVAWAGNQLYVYSTLTHDWAAKETLPANHQVWQASRDASGAYAAAYGWDSGAAWLDVLGPGAPAHLALPPGVDRVRLAFGNGTLWVMAQTVTKVAVYPVDPALPALGDRLTFDTPPVFINPVAAFPFWSRSLNALLVPVVDVRDIGGGTLRRVQAVLYAAAPGQPVRRSGLLPRSLSNPTVLSPDGRLLVSLDQGIDGLDAALLSFDGAALQVTWAGHTDLPGHAGDACFSAAGDELFVTMPFLPALAALQ